MWYVTVDHSRGSGPEVHSFGNYKTAKNFFDETIRRKLLLNRNHIS